MFCTTLLIIFGCSGHANVPNKVIVFGDSLSDLGFQDLLGPINEKSPLWTSPGGETWPFYLTYNLKLRMITVNNSTAPNEKSNYVSALAQGSDYAAGGAVTDGVGIGSTTYFPPSIHQQVNHYLQQEASVDKSKTLAILWGGANDIIVSLSASDPSTAVISAAKNAADNINDYAQLLIKGGLGRVIVINLPDLSQTPFAQKQKSTEPNLPSLLNAASTAFNQELALGLSTRVELFDIQALLDTILKDKAVMIAGKEIRFDNVTDSNCAYDSKKGIASISALTCKPPMRANPKSYLFEDSIHPTDAGHRVIAGKLAEFIQK